MSTKKDNTDKNKASLGKKRLNKAKESRKEENPLVKETDTSSEEHIPADPSVPPNLDDSKKPKEPDPNDENISHRPNEHPPVVDDNPDSQGDGNPDSPLGDSPVNDDSDEKR